MVSVLDLHQIAPPWPLAEQPLNVQPEIISRGFVYMKEADDLIDESCTIVTEALEEALSRGVRNRNKLKDVVKDVMNDYIWKNFKRSPMILPIIVEQE